MSTSTMSATAVRFIEHEGRRIILLDFKGITEVSRGLEVVAEATRFVGATPADKSNVTLTDVRDTVYTREIIDAFKVMTKANAPHVRAAAVVSNSAMHRAAISMIALFSRRKLETFDDREKALDWLASV